MKLTDLLSSEEFKNRVLLTIGLDENVLAAVQKLADHDKGALTVHNEARDVVGIITERDIVRKCFAHSLDLTKIKIRDVMSKDVMIATPEDDLDYAIAVMKRRRIRHLPIVTNQKVTAMISMRDLLGVKLEESTAEVRFLTNYMSNNLW
jgi:CBS domain-containing protein